MEDLIILGTGVHALEMTEIVGRVNSVKETWRLLGYAALDARQAGRELNGLAVLGGPEVIAAYPRAKLIADNTWPRSAPELQGRLAVLVDPSAVISRTAAIGAGCVIYPNCYVGLNARLGRFVFCLSGAVISHDDELGDNVAVTSNVSLAGNVRVGADTYLGQACTVRQDLAIGENCMIGMGAVVVKDVAPDCVMVGNPARKARDRERHPAPGLNRCGVPGYPTPTNRT